MKWYTGKYRTFMCNMGNHKMCGCRLYKWPSCDCTCHLPWGAQLWGWIDSWYET